MPLPPSPAPPSAATLQWLGTLYARMDAGDLDALRSFASPDYHLQIPELGVDIAGLDAVLAWLQVRGTGVRHRLESVTEHGSLLVAIITVEPGPTDRYGEPARDEHAPLERCHVFTRTSEGLAACCVVSGVRVE